jgi:hypothetical protein
MLILGELALCLGEAGEATAGLTSLGRRLPAAKMETNGDTLPSFSASKGSFLYCTARRMPPPRARIFSDKPSRWRTGKALCHGNCGRQQIMRGCGKTNSESPRRENFLERFTSALPKVSRRRLVGGKKPVGTIVLAREQTGSGLDQRGNHRIGRQNGVREGWPIDFVCGMHRLGAEGGRRVPHQCHVIP